MQNLPVYIAIVGFLAMGIGALLKPAAEAAQFDNSELNSGARNEVRAVYGGFGVMVAAALGGALQHPEMRGGVLFTVASAFAGMTAGRLVSATLG
jgi:hypothetical protein